MSTSLCKNCGKQLTINGHCSVWYSTMSIKKERNNLHLHKCKVSFWQAQNLFYTGADCVQACNWKSSCYIIMFWNIKSHLDIESWLAVSSVPRLPTCKVMSKCSCSNGRLNFWIKAATTIISNFLDCSQYQVQFLWIHANGCYSWVWPTDSQPPEDGKELFAHMSSQEAKLMWQIWHVPPFAMDIFIFADGTLPGNQNSCPKHEEGHSYPTTDHKYLSTKNLFNHVVVKLNDTVSPSWMLHKGAGLKVTLVFIHSEIGIVYNFNTSSIGKYTDICVVNF